MSMVPERDHESNASFAESSCDEMRPPGLYDSRSTGHHQVLSSLRKKRGEERKQLTHVASTVT